MGSFLEEIIKGGLGNVLGGSSNSNSGGGMEDIIKDITGRSGSTASTANKKSSGNTDMSDIAKSIRKNAGASGSTPQRTPQEVTIEDVEAETTSSGGGLSDVVKDLRRKMGLDVEEEPTKKTTKKSKKAQEEEEMQQQQQGGINIGGLGGLGAILAILLGQGINLGNLGDIAKSIIKTIGLAGGAMK